MNKNGNLYVMDFRGNHGMKPSKTGIIRIGGNFTIAIDEDHMSNPVLKKIIQNIENVYTPVQVSTEFVPFDAAQSIDIGHNEKRLTITSDNQIVTISGEMDEQSNSPEINELLCILKKIQMAPVHSMETGNITVEKNPFA